jgi:hypothetical protein
LLELSFVAVINYDFDPNFGKLMNYLKSALAGLVAAVVICGILPMLAALAYFYAFVLKRRDTQLETTFYTLHWQAPSLAGWLFVCAVFGIVFVWQLRRLRKRGVSTLPGSEDRPTS